MSKKVIIHGINVSKCIHYKKGCCCTTYVPCKADWKVDCYYKLLQKQKQRNEQLQTNINNLQQIIDNIKKMADEAYLSGDFEVLCDIADYKINDTERDKNAI